MPPTPPTGPTEPVNPARAAEVAAWGLRPLDPTAPLPPGFVNFEGKTTDQVRAAAVEDERREREKAEASARQALVDGAMAYPALDSDDERELLRLVSLAGPFRLLLAVAGAMNAQADAAGRGRDWVFATRRLAQARIITQTLGQIADAESLSQVGK